MSGFEVDFKTALAAKSVPVTVVEDRDKADYEISGTSESHRASTAKKIILHDWRSTEEATIKVTDLKTGVLIFAYSAFKPGSMHGRRSTAEACAKHLKQSVRLR